MRVTRGRWCQQSARRLGGSRAAGGVQTAQARSLGVQQSPQNFAAQGPRPYLQKRRRPRGRGPGDLAEGRPRPGGGLGRVRGSGSGSAPVWLGLRLPRRGCSPRRRGDRAPPRPRPRRLAAAGAEAAAARPPAAGAATPAPREEPRAPPPRALEVPARRSGRSRSHPGPASAGPPRLPGSPPGRARSVRPVPTGSLRSERKRAPQGHPDRRRWGQSWNPKESQGTTLLRTPPSPWPSCPSAAAWDSGEAVEPREMDAEGPPLALRTVTPASANSFCAGTPDSFGLSNHSLLGCPSNPHPLKCWGALGLCT